MNERTEKNFFNDIKRKNSFSRVEIIRFDKSAKIKDTHRIMMIIIIINFYLNKNDINCDKNHVTSIFIRIDLKSSTFSLLIKNMRKRKVRYVNDL